MLPQLKMSRSDIAAAGSGLLTAIPFMWTYSPVLAALAWVSLTPLLMVIHTHPWRRGLIAGICFFAPVLYWLNHVMLDYGGLHLFASLGLYLLLTVYLAMFWGAGCWCSMRIIRRCDLPLFLVFPLVWIAFEFLRGKLLTGFPWGSIVYSQASLPLMVQSVDVGGIWLPMLVLLVVNCVIAQTVQMLWPNSELNRPRKTSLIRVPVAIGLFVFLMNAGYGLFIYQKLGLYESRISSSTGSPEGSEPDSAIQTETQTLDVALIQANIDQHQKWLRSNRDHTLNLYTAMSRENSAVDLIVWPESATPFYYINGSRYADAVNAVARDQRVNLLFGSPAYLQTPQGKTYLNSAYLLDRMGSLVARTDKVHLVPFGEYVPLSSVLGFVDKMAAGVGDFRPGTLKLLPLAGDEAGVLICYEVIFPRLARAQVKRGAGLLFNLTNDAWFGNTPAPHQHLQMARFRAMENRRWLARCANTGVSALIDPRGMLHGPTEVFTAGVVSGRVTFRHDLTPYTRYGDVLAWMALALLTGWMWQSRKKTLSAHG